jgi:hypothetical protein
MLAKLGVSYFGVRNPEHVARDLKRMAVAGCNVVLHTFSENDLRFYLETMREIVSLSKEHGFEVHLDPWGVGGVFGGEAFTQFALEHDLARQVLSDGVRAPAACPNSPRFREFMREWVGEAVKIGADVIFFDEPHFWNPQLLGRSAGPWGCRCERCQEGYRARCGAPMPLKFTSEVREFQEQSLLSFLGELAKAVHRLGAKVALCLLPEWQDPEGVVRRWAEFAALEDIDIFGTDPYWMWAGQPFSRYEFFARAVRELADEYGKEPQIWIQACKVPEGREWEVRRAVETAWRLGIRNIMAWSFLGTPYMTRVRSDRPEVVWRELSAAYLAIRGRRE